LINIILEAKMNPESSDDLAIVEQREVTFYGDELIAVQTAGGDVYVSLPSMCQALGLNVQAQARRIKRHEVLTAGYTKLAILASQGKEQTQRRLMGVLRADLVPLWLSGLSVMSIRPEMQPKIKRYQHEAARVLWEAFQEGRLTADPTFDELLAGDSPAAQAYKMAAAIMTLARQQILLESRLTDHGARLDDHQQRLETVEATLGDSDRYISNAQASRISQAVKAVAMHLSKISGRNEYGGVYGELYRRYDIASYRELPAGKYEDAIAWLGEWYQQLTDSDLPF